MDTIWMSAETGKVSSTTIWTFTLRKSKVSSYSLLPHEQNNFYKKKYVTTVDGYLLNVKEEWLSDDVEQKMAAEKCVPSKER